MSLNFKYLLALFFIFIINNELLVISCLKQKRETQIIVPDSNCYNETCYNSIDDIENSPLIECSYL